MARDFNVSYSKNCQTKEISVSADRDSHGTTIFVQDLFYNLPVRRKASKGNNELLKVREFVQRMSILHYGISWVCVDTSCNRILFKCYPNSSVSSRLGSLYSTTIVRSMKVTCRLSRVQFIDLINILRRFTTATRATFSLV